MSRFKSQATRYKPDYALYAKLKEQWIKEHPEASPEHYTQAMIAIAQRCGI